MSLDGMLESRTYLHPEFIHRYIVALRNGDRAFLAIHDHVVPETEI